MNAVLVIPLKLIIRLMGAAIEATGNDRAPGAHSDRETDESIARALDEKAREAGANI